MNTPNGVRDDLGQLYRHRFSELDRTRKAALWRVLVEDFFQQWVAPADVVLDLGCGYGEFLNNVRCARRIGVDLNPDCPRFLERGVEFHYGKVEDLSFLLDASVDLVFSSNTLEHLAGKPEVERVLDEVARVLVPGGHLVLLGPNLRYLPGAYWDFWDHAVPITDRSLVEALGARGFKISDHYARFLPYTTRSGLPQSPSLVKWYLRLRPAWQLFGRQFLVRAEAPSVGSTSQSGA